MRIFRSTTLDSNANTYVGSYGEITVGDDLQLRIQDNITPGGTGVTGDVTFSGNTMSSVGERVYVQADFIPSQPYGYQLGTPDNPWLRLNTNSLLGYNVTIDSSGSYWLFNNDGSTSFPGYTFPYGDGTPGQVLATDGSGMLSWISVSAGNGNVSTGNYTFSGDYLLMPDVARLNSGGIGITRSAEFGTAVSMSGPSVVNTSNIYMSAGTGEARIMVDASGRGLAYYGVENPGFAGMVSMDPLVTSQYAIDEVTGNIIIGATQPSGTITTTDYRAGLGVLNDSYTINGLYADTTHVVISSSSSGGVHTAVSLTPERFAVKTDLGNAYTLTDQTSNRWELFAEDDLTGPYLAYSSIRGHLEDINAPNVVIETRRAYDTDKIFWTFDHTGNLTLPQDGYLGSLYGNPNELSMVSPPGGAAIVGSFTGNSYVRVGESAVFVGTSYRTVPYEWIFNNDGRTLFPGYEFPAEDGAPGQVLVTDGSGSLSWQANSGLGNSISYGNTSVSIPASDGNVIVTVNGYQWQFANDGTLYFPANGYQQQNVVGTTTQVRGIPYPAGYLNGVGNVWTASAEDVVGADLLVRAHGNNGSAAETTTEISRITVVKDAWDLSAQPSITVYGQVTSNATINLTTFDANTNGGNLLVITGNTIPHGSGRYFTYTVTEFKRTVD